MVIQLVLLIMTHHDSPQVHLNFYYLKDDEEKVLLSLLNLLQLLFFTFDAFFGRHRSVIINRKVIASLLRM